MLSLRFLHTPTVELTRKLLNSLKTPIAELLAGVPRFVVGVGVVDIDPPPPPPLSPHDQL